MDYTNLIKALIALLSTIISAFLVPWLKMRIDANKLEKLEALARVSVYAAEQLFTSEEREQKKTYVQQYLSAKGYRIDTAEVDIAIEAAVLALHHELKEGAA